MDLADQGEAIGIHVDAYRQSATEVLRELRVQAEHGLSQSDALRRLNGYGRNELIDRGFKSPLLILVEQFASSVVIVLIIAGVVSALLGDYKDSVAIGAIVLLNAILGFHQEYRAEKTLAALKKLATPRATVRRDGEVRSIPQASLVPGDVVLLGAGSLVPADCRLVESHELRTVEAALTGESQPISKMVGPLDKTNLPLGDRRNMAYLGTSVAAGRGVAIVTQTGMRTELGRIADMVQTVGREPTPLQRRLHHLGRVLAGAALLLVAVIFVLGLARGEEWRLIFLTAVSMGVAAIPEGLPAVVTIALALGSQRMLRRNALIRKLPAVETLGSVTVICSDKTGTLTENRMRVATIRAAEHSHELESEPRSLPHKKLPGRGLDIMLTGVALCNDAQFGGSEVQSMPLGDPTEVALAIAAADFGLQRRDLEQAMPRVAELPFSSERKRMTTLHRVAQDPSRISPELAAVSGGSLAGYIAFCKGAADVLMELSATVWLNGAPQPFTAEWRRSMEAAHREIAQGGMRVIALAFRWFDALPADMADVEQAMTFLGLFGLMDPPRKEAAPAVATCYAAGIRPVMITGDHPLTAQTIAKKVGIAAAKPLSGPDLDDPSVQLGSVVASTTVYARVAPSHKLKIVEALQQNGEVVAMTGDGVNDAPALKKANVGVAMGITGTDVAKEAADIVLLDDNFATIVAAVEEGRIIYDNIRKFIKYILATNSGEILTMLIAPFLGMPLPLLPLQILWMNLVTDGLPALALGAEPAEADTMRRPPYPPNESIFARGMGLHVLWVGFLMAFLSLALGYGYWHANRANWQTMLFTTLTFSQMAHVMAIRSERSSLLAIGLTTNKPLLGAVTLTIALQFGLIYIPLFQNIFQTTPLPVRDLSLVMLFSLVILIAIEFEKKLKRAAHR